MVKKIDFGKTSLSDLYQVLKFSSQDDLEKKTAKLFPSGNTDNEVGTTSIFLASLSAIKEYREELLSGIGINKLKARNASLHAYTEIYDTDSKDRPDGLLVITSGKHNPIIEWACFIESKVKDKEITTEQVEKYIEFAKKIGINDIITISNYLVTNPNDSPIQLKKRNFNLYHWSWTYLKVTGSRLIRTDSIKDEDHIYILKELRRYFDSHKNLSNYVNMGKEWKSSVNQIHSYQASDRIDNKLLNHIIESYKQEEKDVCLQLTDSSNYHVELNFKKDRLDEISESLQKSKTITSQLILNKDKKNTFSIEVDFIRQKVTCFTTIFIDKGKAQAQISTLIKMFEDIGATDHIIVNGYYNRKKTTGNNVSLTQLIEERSKSEPYSILNKEFGDEIKTFEIKTEELLGKNFQSTKNFIIKIEALANRFLSEVMANNKL